MNLPGLTLTPAPTIQARLETASEVGLHPSPQAALHSASGNGPHPPSDWARRMEEALETERGLLERLEGILQGQRRAVEGDDLAALEEETHAARRVLRTLSEAQRRRTALLELGVGDPEAPLGALEELGVRPGPSLIRAREGLRETARRLALALAFNRALIGRAERNTDRQVRAVLGAPPSTGGQPYADSSGDAMSPGSGRYLNRQV